MSPRIRRPTRRPTATTAAAPTTHAHTCTLQSLGLGEDQIGSLEPGKDADLVVIDDDVNVYLTMVKGQEIFVAHDF